MKTDYLKSLLEHYYPLHFFALSRAHELYNVEPFIGLLKPPILDLGSGDGLIARLLFGRQLEFGIDPSEKAVSKAKETMSYRQVFLGDARSIPLEPNSLGGVFSNCALEHIPQLEACIKEVARVLRPGSYFVATAISPFYYSLNTVFKGLDKPGLRWLRRKAIRAENALQGHVSVFDRETYGKIFQANGMKLEIHKYYCAGQVASFCSLWDTLSKYVFPYPAHLIHGGILTRYLQLRYGRKPRRNQIDSWYERFYEICYQRNGSNMGIGQILVAKRADKDSRH